MLRITLAVIHLYALGIGLGSVYARARAANKLGEATDTLSRTFAADTWWGVSALLWISTGLWRVFAATEKATSYYWQNHIFLAKMGFLLLVIALEIWPMVALIRLRKASATRALPSAEQLAATGRRIARISDVQILLVLAMVVAAVMMARGYGAR